MQMKKYIKSEKGAMTIYVTATIVSFIIVLTAIFYTASAVRKNQLKTVLEIKEVYAQYNGKIQEIYEERDKIIPKEIANVIKRGLSGETQIAVDEYGNKIVIPAGFIVKEHSGTEISDVKYSYTGNNIPAVQDGIVIENVEDGNQFVWVPIGDIKNKDNTTTTITLGRYADFTMAADGTAPAPVQVASKTNYDIPITLTSESIQYVEISSSFAGGTFEETTYDAANSYGNIKAYDLEEWISTTLDNGGYYIARYEASKNGEKGASKISTGTPTENKETTIEDGMLWTYLTQPEAAIAAQAMYPATEKADYYSDLINSYAWDTAIIFIQLYSGFTNYSVITGDDMNPTLSNTGESDRMCNIYNMCGNVREWTTETSPVIDKECTVRGGNSSSMWNTTVRRVTFSNTEVYRNSFRTILCTR